MPQLFQVLRCYKCLVFQVHQTKQSNKLACKLCGEKQSIKRHYGLGTAKDCRLHVQKLNGIRGEIDEIIDQNKTDSTEEGNENEDIVPSIDPRPKVSKWADYVDKEEVTELVSDKNMYLDKTEVVLDVPKKRPKTLSGNKNFKTKIFKPPTNANECEGISSTKISPLQTINNIDNDNMSPKDTKSHLLLEYGPVLDSNPEYISESVICKKKKNMPLNKLIPTKTNSNSKWAQFVDTEANDDDEFSLSTGNSQSNLQTLFSLCDDADLDDVLDI